MMSELNNMCLMNNTFQPAFTAEVFVEPVTEVRQPDMQYTTDHFNRIYSPHLVEVLVLMFNNSYENKLLIFLFLSTI